jgi:hypothetical protein
VEELTKYHLITEKNAWMTKKSDHCDLSIYTNPCALKRC